MYVQCEFFHHSLHMSYLPRQLTCRPWFKYQRLENLSIWPRDFDITLKWDNRISKLGYLLHSVNYVMRINKRTAWKFCSKSFRHLSYLKITIKRRKNGYLLKMHGMLKCLHWTSQLFAMENLKPMENQFQIVV